MMDEKAKIYSFGEFQLVLDERTLLRGGEPVALQPKCFDTLAYLVENSGRVLEKDELIQTLWPDSFVEEGNLAQNIFVLRKVLGDDRNGHSFIKTIPRRGYKFVAPVSQAEPASGNGVPAAYWGQHSPFRSLRAFEAEDAWLFFGREAEIGELVGRLGKSPVLVVAGNSGCGKSSLLRAGLVAALNEGEGEEAAWRIAVFRPSANPFDYLAEVLPGLLAPELSAKEQAELIADCRNRFPSDENGLRDVISALAGANRMDAGPTRVLLVADQFEEIFTLTSSKEARDRYIDLLLAAARAHGPAPVHLVLALRADFFANCLEHGGLSRCLETNLYNVPRMGREQLRETIEKRLQLAAAQAEPGLIDALLEDAGEEPGNLALLEHALGQLWSRCGGFSRTLTNSGYAEIGRLRGALGRHADEVYHGLRDDSQKRLAQRIFLELVTVGENAGVQDTRRTVRKKDLLALSGAPEETEQLLAGLASSRLIATSGEGEDAFAEVSHEALIREWPLLREWIAQNREELRLGRRLLQAAEEWQALERDSGTLLQGARLAQAEEWLARQAKAAALVGEFVHVSVIARDAAEQKKLAARKREALRLRWFASILAVLLLIAAGAAAFTYRLQKLERSRALAAQAEEMLGRDQGQALDLAIRAWRTDRTDEARLAVTKGYPQLLSVLKHDGMVIVAAFSPDGKKVVTGSDDHTARVWSVPDGRLLAVLPGHIGQIWHANFSHDGQRIVTSGEDHVARVWSVVDGRQIATLKGHTAAIYQAIFSPDDRHIITGSADSTARIWNATDGQSLTILQGHTQRVLDVALSPDGHRILTCSTDKTARVWKSEDGRLLFTLSGHTNEIISGRFSPDGRQVVTTSFDKTARIWDSTDGHLMATLRHEAPTLSAIFSPDGRRVFTSSYDHTARIWNSADGGLIATLRHTGIVLHLSLSSDGKYIATSSEDGTGKIWSSSTGRLLATLHGHTSYVDYAIFSPNAPIVITTSGDRTARMWNIAATGHPFATLRGHAGEVYRALFSSDDRHILTTSSDHTARIWDSSAERLLVTLEGHSEVVCYGDFSSDGQTVVTASLDKTARIWRSTDGHLLATLPNPNPSCRLIFSPDGRRIAIPSQNAVYLWDSNTAALVMMLQGHSDFILAVQFSPDGQRIVTASKDKTARVWNAGDGRLLATLAGHSDLVFVAVFSPDGQRILTVSFDHTARLWDATTGQLLHVLQGHSDEIWAGGFSPDGRHIVTGSKDKTVRIWDGLDGHLERTLKGHTDAIRCVEFSPDGQKILSASKDITARVWRAADGGLLAVLQGHGDELHCARFSHDGQRMVTASWDLTARVWRLLTLDDIDKLLYK